MLFKIEKLLLSIQNGNFIFVFKRKGNAVITKTVGTHCGESLAPEKINEIKIEWSCSFSLLEDT